MPVIDKGSERFQSAFRLLSELKEMTFLALFDDKTTKDFIEL
jgi:hypothetical protein